LPVQTKRTFFTVGTRSERVYQTRSEPVQVNFRWSNRVVSSVICGFSEWRIAVIVTTVPVAL